MHQGSLSTSLRRIGLIAAGAVALLALTRTAHAEDTAIGEGGAGPAPATTVMTTEPATQDAPAKKTHPRYWLTATGAITFGGAYVANAVLFPLAVIDPPDGPSSPSTLWYLTPVVGPFALAAKLSQFDNGLRRFEWIDGSLQTVGLAMVAASFLFPVENEKTEKHETATIHPVVSPRFIGASGTF